MSKEELDKIEKKIRKENRWLNFKANLPDFFILGKIKEKAIKEIAQKKSDIIEKIYKEKRTEIVKSFKEGLAVKISGSQQEAIKEGSSEKSKQEEHNHDEGR